MSRMFVKVSLSNNFNKPVILSDGLQPSSPKVFFFNFFQLHPKSSCYYQFAHHMSSVLSPLINQFCKNSGRRYLWSEFCHLWFPPRWCLRFGETIEIGSREYQWGHPWGWWWWFWPRWGWFWSWTSIAIYWKYTWQFAPEKTLTKH